MKAQCGITRRDFVLGAVQAGALAGLGGLAVVQGPRPVAAAEAKAPKKVGPDPREWNQVVDRALGYLRKAQLEDGSWGSNRSPGITGVVLTGVLKTGRVGHDDPMVRRALKYIESLINPAQHHIAGKNAPVTLQNYVTSVNVMALVAADRKDYQKVIGNATEFLKKLQWDESEGKGKSSDFYGGFGYDHSSRPDLSNTQFALEALVSAGIPKDDPALKKALIFVSRCQNLKGENANDQPWAGKLNDGSFIYSPAGGGQSKAGKTPDGGLPGYGSMTYAGIKSMIYCGVTQDDPRVKTAYAWVREHYTVDANPGMPKVMAQQGLYYYYHTMAKALAVLGKDHVVDARGRRHDWRADITHALAKRQKPDGSWKNQRTAWMEGDPDLDVGFALMALCYCKTSKGERGVSTP